MRSSLISTECGRHGRKCAGLVHFLSRGLSFVAELGGHIATLGHFSRKWVKSGYQKSPRRSATFPRRPPNPRDVPRRSATFPRPPPDLQHPAPHGTENPPKCHVRSLLLVHFSGLLGPNIARDVPRRSATFPRLRPRFRGPLGRRPENPKNSTLVPESALDCCPGHFSVLFSPISANIRIDTPFRAIFCRANAGAPDARNEMHRFSLQAR